jgi:hypothetical protein
MPDSPVRVASESGHRKRFGFVRPDRNIYDRVIVRRETSRSRSRQKAPAASVPTVRLLLQDVADGIRVLQTRDGVELSDEQIQERARNIVAGLVGNYRIKSLEAREVRAPGSLTQMDLLDQLERRAEARNNGRSGRA